MKKFDIPEFYKSPIIGKVKSIRKAQDPWKKDYTPTHLDFGSVQFYIPRHFGFCYGVENAVEIAYKTIQNNPDKRIYLLSEMIHNPLVNADLQDRGIRFIMDTAGNQLIEWSEVTKNDIVLIPAFGTTLEIEQKLKDIGLEIQQYNTTCPFVEKVWKTSTKLGKSDYTVVIHGKPTHEETRASFSHAKNDAKSLVVKNMEETQILSKIILGELPMDHFHEVFKGRFSEGFDPEKDLDRVGVVNQTTISKAKP